MLITLLSDLGLRDPSVAVVKGVLMNYTHSPIIDISHEIKPFFLPQAAYLFSAAYKNFPPGTCHLLLFDLFSVPVPRLLLSEHNGQYFLSPDNGLLPMALGEVPGRSYLVYELKANGSFTGWINAAASVIKMVADNKEPDFPPYQLKTHLIPDHTVIENKLLCEIIHIDRYENIILNVTKKQFEKTFQKRPFRLQFMQVEEINEISDNYNDVREGYKLCRFNSNDHLEICINRGKAASLFGFRLGGNFNDIKIAAE